MRIAIGRSISRVACVLLVLVFGIADAVADRVELSVTADWEQVQYLGGKDATEKVITRVVNQTAAIYKEALGVDLVISHMDIPSTPESPFFSTTLKGADLLDEVRGLRQVDPQHARADITILFTNRKFTSEDGKAALGLAYVGTVSSTDAVALAAIPLNGYDYQILAHEIGHTLGAVHDGEGPCVNEPTFGWIMAPMARAADQFSQCSIELMQAELKAKSVFFSEEPLQQSPVPTPSDSLQEIPSAKSGGGGALDIYWSVIFLILGLLRRSFKG